MREPTPAHASSVTRGLYFSSHEYRHHPVGRLRAAGGRIPSGALLRPSTRYQSRLTSNELPASDLVGKPDDESVPVRHLNFRQRAGVHHVVLADDLVEVEEISGCRINFVV